MKGKTNKKTFAKKCKEVHRKIAEMRILPLPKIIKKLNQMLVGYYHYYGITDNSKGINDFCFRVQRSLFYWLNRRSQNVEKINESIKGNQDDNEIKRAENLDKSMLSAF